jgi:DNA-3-methyladenine glycosylase
VDSLVRFLSSPATEVAPRVLGATLTARNVRLCVTEVEAYLGIGEDPGSHAFVRRSNRNATMFGPPAHLYVYLTYGVQICANIVCSREGEASAILLRAGRVTAGVDDAFFRRQTSRSINDLARGPSRLTKALGISLADDGADLVSGRIRLELADEQVDFLSGPRTGVSGPGGTAKFPWRFWIPGDPTVSPYRAHRRR